MTKNLLSASKKRRKWRSAHTVAAASSVGKKCQQQSVTSQGAVTGDSRKWLNSGSLQKRRRENNQIISMSLDMGDDDYGVSNSISAVIFRPILLFCMCTAVCASCTLADAQLGLIKVWLNRRRKKRVTSISSCQLEPSAYAQLCMGRKVKLCTVPM